MGLQRWALRLAQGPEEFQPCRSGRWQDRCGRTLKCRATMQWLLRGIHLYWRKAREVVRGTSKWLAFTQAAPKQDEVVPQQK